MDTPNHHKSLLEPLRAAMSDFDAAGVRGALNRLMDGNAIIHMCHPFGDLMGADAFYDACYTPLLTAMPDLERRDYIVMAGTDEHGRDWVGCAGFYCGTHKGSFLGIPATGHLAHMRFHEFYAFENDKVVEAQIIWDIPELMMQSDAWPMGPSLGRYWCPPAPMTQDGLVAGPYDAVRSAKSRKHILDMLIALCRHPAEPPEAMEMPKYWHPKMNWYGPTGIGTARGIDGFRNWHQIPFLNGMPDRGQNLNGTNLHFFADGDYVGVTGWPNMSLSITQGGWLGIPPVNKPIKLRSLDFWRIENDLIRENWVLVDLLDMYDQIGVDVLARMREFTSARQVA